MATLLAAAWRESLIGVLVGAAVALTTTAEAFFRKGKLPFGVTANVGSPPVPVTREYERFTDVVDDSDRRARVSRHPPMKRSASSRRTSVSTATR